MRINTRHAIIIIILLLLCLFDMPYGYFMFVRLVTAISCIYRGYLAYEEDQKELMFVFFGIAILFQPLIKIHLGRMIWNIADVVLAVFLGVLTTLQNKKYLKKKLK